jgi:hypothetical protein
MKVQPREAMVGIAAVVLSGLAIAGGVAHSTVLTTFGLVALLCLVVGLLLAIVRQVSDRATIESVAHLRKRVDELAVRTATDAAANHREMAAAMEKLADEVRPRT